MKSTFLCAALLSAFSLSSAHADVLAGDYLKVGYSNSGDLIDHGSFVGIKFDPAGKGNFGSVDFLTPGSPLAFYSLGVGGSYQTASSSDNPFGAVTSNLSSAFGKPTALTYLGQYHGLTFSQALQFDKGSSVIHVGISFTNSSAGALNNVVYATGFDPDQDSYVNGEFRTLNNVRGESVSAYGATTKYTITLSNSGSQPAVASVSHGWDTNPYSLLSYAPVTGDYSDSTIALAYNLGSIAAGQTKSLSYDIALTGAPSVAAPVPEPETYAMLIAGLGILSRLARRRKTRS